MLFMSERRFEETLYKALEKERKLEEVRRDLCYLMVRVEQLGCRLPSRIEYENGNINLENLKCTRGGVFESPNDNPSPVVYPTWLEWLRDNLSTPIPEEIAKKLGVEPVKEDG